MGKVEVIWHSLGLVEQDTSKLASRDTALSAPEKAILAATFLAPTFFDFTSASIAVSRHPKVCQ